MGGGLSIGYAEAGSRSVEAIKKGGVWSDGATNGARSSSTQKSVVGSGPHEEPVKISSSCC